MQHVSKKLIRLTIMDALDQVLKGRTKRALSKSTKMAIIEAVEKIAENLEQDFNEHINKGNIPNEKTITLKEESWVDPPIKIKGSTDY